MSSGPKIRPRPNSPSPVTVGLVFIGAGLVALLLVEAFLATGRVGWDAFTYLAAGERLNAGHQLYELGPGDRWIWINPPYWTVPLLYPPTIAVLWRPLAALPSELGVPLWTLIDSLCLILAVVWIIARGGWRPALMAVILAPALAFEIKVGNLHGLILASLVLVYHRPRAGALAIGLITAIKLTPAVVIVWLYANGHRREAMLGTTVAALALGGSIVHAGFDQFGLYLAAVQSSAPSTISVPGLLLALGAPGARLVGWGLTAFLVLEVVVLRARPLSWVVAVVALVLGSPVVNIPTFVLLMAVWLPYPWRSPSRSPAGAGSDSVAGPAGTFG